MNLLFLDQFSELGGAQRCLVDLLPAIRRRGWSAHLAVPGRGPLVELSRPFCASINDLVCGPYQSGEKNWLDFPRFAYQLPQQVRTIGRMIAERKMDLVYVNGPRLLPAAVLAVKSLPLVFHAHSRVTQRAARSLAGVCLRMRKVTVIASSSFVAEPWKKHAAADRVHLVYNGVPGLASGERAQDGAFRVGVIGRIAPEKGQLEFVQAARRALQQHAGHLKFVICGAPMFSQPGYDAQVHAAAEGLPIEFTGWRDDISPVLATLNLLVVPSGAAEATPRTILEAYSARVPVVAFRSGGIPEVVEDGRTGWLVEPTIEALAAKIVDLSVNPGQLSEAAERAYQAWRDRYTLERYQNEIVRILESALRSRRQRASDK